MFAECERVVSSRLVPARGFLQGAPAIRAPPGSFSSNLTAELQLEEKLQIRCPPFPFPPTDVYEQ